MSVITTQNNSFALHGQWKRTIGGQGIDFVQVPGGYPPVGECLLETTFATPWDLAEQDRVFLCVEGVLARGEFSLNGHPLGVAGPWAPYRFEIPNAWFRDKNVITARMRDILEPFGPTPGRRFDAGIIRDISLERKPATFIETIAFRPRLNEACTCAECEVAVKLNGAASGVLEAVLTERESGRVVASSSAPVGSTLQFTMDGPLLWSPQLPNLYTLTVKLIGECCDTVGEIVGIRRIEVRGQDFYVNNRRTLLKGICRHEFTSAHSYSPPVEEVRHELALIKNSGFNYVRLVHSPHSTCVSRIAAELGLFVSEEPGTCFHDLGDDTIAAPALETLRRVVLRDRNCPSVFAWYIYNECDPNVSYAQKAAQVCRSLDPDRLLSFADCSGKHDAIKEMLNKADLSYYGINHYTMSPNDYVERMSHYTDRPLVITEWGGCNLVGNPRLLKQHCDTFVRHGQQAATPRIAGCTFWAWADYEEYSRSEPATVEGWTIEGLLDERARPRHDLQLLSHLCFEMDYPPMVFAPPVEVLIKSPQRDGPWTSVDLSNIAGNQAPLEAMLAQMRARFAFNMPVFGKLSIAGIDFLCRDYAGPNSPLLLGKDRPDITIPVNQTVCEIAILGHVALQGGYPSSTIYSVHHRDAEPEKAYGQIASRYELIFDDGSVFQPLEHGVHILRGNNICRWWKTAPRSPQTQPAVQTVLHPTYEILRYDLWETRFDKPRRLQAIRWTLEDQDTIQAIMAISVLQH